MLPMWKCCQFQCCQFSIGARRGRAAWKAAFPVIGRDGARPSRRKEGRRYHSREITVRTAACPPHPSGGRVENFARCSNLTRTRHRCRGGSTGFCRRKQLRPLRRNRHSNFRRPSREHLVKQAVRVGRDEICLAFRQGWQFRKESDEVRYWRRLATSVQTQYRRRCHADPDMPHLRSQCSSSQPKLLRKIRTCLRK